MTVEDGEELSTLIRVKGGTTEERLAMVAEHGRIIRWKYAAGAIGVTGFWAFMSTCVYVQCGG